jgi:hypothetical protein
MIDDRFARQLALFNEAQRAHLHAYLDKVQDTVAGLYVYCTSDASPEFIVVRLSEPGGKTFRICHFDGDELVFKKPAKPAAGFALYGGHLPRRHPESTIVVCEGEKATLALNLFVYRAGAKDRYVALTSGGANSAQAANWGDLAGRDVSIWADKDAPGIAYAKDVAERLRGIARSCNFVDVRRLALPPSGDAADWVAAQPETSVGLLGALPVTADLPVLGTADLPEAPLPLFHEAGERQVFPVDALGPILGGAAQAIAAAVQCPEVIAGNAVLAATAFAAQALVDVHVDGRITPTSLFVLTVAGSGERKTSADNLAMGPVYAFQKRVHAKYLEDLKAYRVLCKGLAKGDVPPDAPTDPTAIIQDTTNDAMIRGLIYGRPSQALVLSEGGSFLGGYAMSRDAMLRTATFLATIWSGDMISQARVTGRHMASDRRLTVHLRGQPDVVAKFVGNELLQNQGLLPRFLMAEPESHIGHRLYAKRNIQEDPAYQAYVDRLDGLLAVELPIGAGGGLRPRALLLSDAAYPLWVAAHDAIERASAPDGALDRMQAYAAKLAEHILRIAGVITLIEDPDAAEVAGPTMEGAIRLAHFYLHEAGRLMIRPGDPGLSQAKALLDWLRRQPSPIALRDVYRNGPRFVRSAKEARKLIDELREHHWVTGVEEDVLSSDGKLSRENYEVCPDV